MQNLRCLRKQEFEAREEPYHDYRFGGYASLVAYGGAAKPSAPMREEQASIRDERDGLHLE